MCFTSLYSDFLPLDHQGGRLIYTCHDHRDSSNIVGDSSPIVHRIRDLFLQNKVIHRDGQILMRQLVVSCGQFSFPSLIVFISELTKGLVKGAKLCFRNPYFYFRHGESTSTASQLTSPASQKSKDLNKVLLLLQDLA